MTAGEYRAMLDVHRTLVERGWHPAVAGRLVTRSAFRLLSAVPSGLGKIQPTRRVQRDLVPGLQPRPTAAGERCRHIQEVPGSEERIYSEVNALQSQGWNVMEVEASRGFPRLRTFYACPPGATPMEAQPSILSSEPWGAPLYTGIGQAEPLAAVARAAEAAPIKAVREAVSPWLWVLSVVGFGMTLLNTRRIAAMFRRWKGRRGAR